MPFPFQIFFVILGSASMILLQFLDIKELGCTEEEAVVNVVGGDSLECQLQSFDASWPVPLNFTCVDGALKPVLPAVASGVVDMS